MAANARDILSYIDVATPRGLEVGEGTQPTTIVLIIERQTNQNGPHRSKYHRI